MTRVKQTPKRRSEVVFFLLYNVGNVGILLQIFITNIYLLPDYFRSPHGSGIKCFPLRYELYRFFFSLNEEDIQHI